MVYFKEIQPTDHYLSEHEKEVPWSEVIKVIFKTKNPRKKDGLFEIESDKYYLLFKIQDAILYVINAKRK